MGLFPRWIHDRRYRPSLVNLSFGLAYGLVSLLSITVLRYFVSKGSSRLLFEVFGFFFVLHLVFASLYYLLADRTHYEFRVSSILGTYGPLISTSSLVYGFLNQLLFIVPGTSNVSVFIFWIGILMNGLGAVSWASVAVYRRYASSS